MTTTPDAFATAAGSNAASATNYLLTTSLTAASVSSSPRDATAESAAKTELQHEQETLENLQNVNIALMRFLADCISCILQFVNFNQDYQYDIPALRIEGHAEIKQLLEQLEIINKARANALLILFGVLDRIYKGCNDDEMSEIFSSLIDQLDEFEILTGEIDKAIIARNYPKTVIAEIKKIVDKIAIKIHARETIDVLIKITLQRYFRTLYEQTYDQAFQSVFLNIWSHNLSDMAAEWLARRDLPYVSFSKRWVANNTKITAQHEILKNLYDVVISHLEDGPEIIAYLLSKRVAELESKVKKQEIQLYYDFQWYYKISKKIAHEVLGKVAIIVKFSPHYKVSALTIKSLEEIWNWEMSDDKRAVVTYGGAGLLGVTHYYFHNWFGLNPLTVQLITSPIMEYLNLKKLTRQIINFLLFMGLAYFKIGNDGFTLSCCAASYAASSWLASYWGNFIDSCTDYFFPVYRANKVPKPALLHLIKFSAESAVLVYSNKYAFEEMLSLRHRFFPEAEIVGETNILSTKEKCFTDQEKCRRVGLRFFDLADDAQYEDVRQAFNKLSLTCSADKLAGAESPEMCDGYSAEVASMARRRLRELEDLREDQKMPSKS